MKKLCFTLLLIAITQSCLAENIFDRGKSFFDDLSNIDDPMKMVDKCTEKHDADSCWRAGNTITISYREAKKAGKDSAAVWLYAYATLAYQHGCDLGGKKSCYDGATFAKKEGDPKFAYELYSKGCRLGHKDSCEQEAILGMSIKLEKVEEELAKKQQKPNNAEKTENLPQNKPVEYKYRSDFQDGLAHVEINDKWGFINKSGELVIPAKYDGAADFSEGLAGVKINGKWGFINKSGELVIPAKYDNIYKFSEGLASVGIYGNGFIKRSGLLLRNTKYGFINKSGELVIPAKYDRVHEFSEGLASVEINGKWGFINKSGELVIPAKYDNIYEFSEGLASVEINGKWGFINKSGELVIPAKYDNFSFFRNGLAQVMLNGESECINKSGRDTGRDWLKC